MQRSQSAQSQDNQHDSISLVFQPSRAHSIKLLEICCRLSDSSRERRKISRSFVQETERRVEKSMVNKSRKGTVASIKTLILCGRKSHAEPRGYALKLKSASQDENPDELQWKKVRCPAGSGRSVALQTAAGYRFAHPHESNLSCEQLACESHNRLPVCLRNYTLLNKPRACLASIDKFHLSVPQLHRPDRVTRRSTCKLFSRLCTVVVRSSAVIDTKDLVTPDIQIVETSHLPIFLGYGTSNRYLSKMAYRSFLHIFVDCRKASRISIYILIDLFWLTDNISSEG